MEYGDGSRTLVEVKGVTLEREGVLLFPDAPTQRGTKHLRELAAALGPKTRCCILFVAQMKGPRVFCPSAETDPEFARALGEAAAAGVQVLCRDCLVTPHSMVLDGEIEVRLKAAEG